MSYSSLDASTMLFYVPVPNLSLLGKATFPFRFHRVRTEMNVEQMSSCKFIDSTNGVGNDIS